MEVREQSHKKLRQGIGREHSHESNCAVRDVVHPL